MMKIEGAKHLFYELLDQWTDDYKAASELRLKVTEAFANVANGGATRYRAALAQTITRPIQINLTTPCLLIKIT
jgi:hypothetical protein